MLRHVRDHWVAILLVVMFATATIFNFDQSAQVERNRQDTQDQQIVFNNATCALRDATNDQLAAIEKLRAATDAALDVGLTVAVKPSVQVDFKKLSQDVSNIAIEPVTVPPDVVCNSDQAAKSQARLDRP